MPNCFPFQTDVTENDELLLVLTKSGRTVYMPESLLNKLNEEQETWHWTPWLRTRVEYVDNIAREMVARDSIESFPDGIFTGNGYVSLQALFTLLTDI